MMSLSVEDYMKRLDQLASMSVGTPGSTTGRQPLRNLSVNNQRAAETEATQKDTAILKPSQLKLAATRLPVPRHEAAADDDRTEEETLTRSCTEDQDDNDEEESVSMRPAFRTRTIWKDVDDELDSLWTLKRASPITDANDEEEDYLSQYQSPAKRSRVQTLVWSESLPETSESVQELLQRR